jgi:hypothetical protein
MIESFFRDLNLSGARYLLISGQASVLYGAATFSEDIDLWLEPSQQSIDLFRSVLRAHAAAFYKLTPPFELEIISRGHGFHFVLPQGGENDTFLDVMGCPPRTGLFVTALESSNLIETEWGLVPTIAIRDLVELKKTQRIEDYPVIGRLALVAATEGLADPEQLRWVVHNIFTLPELRRLFEEVPEILYLWPEDQEVEMRQLGVQIVGGAEVTEAAEKAVQDLLQRRLGACQEADRRYWRPIVAELRAFRRNNQLMREGEAV